MAGGQGAFGVLDAGSYSECKHLQADIRFCLTAAVSVRFASFSRCLAPAAGREARLPAICAYAGMLAR